ncbi:F-box domain-containing protein [Mycena sanguinolenta]|uniref:F-box domain-containing protein n=1 Tax=Mycena sanguinolenta TaxID=230812 RepID=A0A8H6YAT6_9AGAR|nr:F-box domain-containing protein [Mycena sanguinolenta]
MVGPLRSAPLSIPISINLERRAILNHRVLDEALTAALRWCSLTLKGRAPFPLVRRLAGCRLDSVKEFIAPSFTFDFDSGTAAFTNLPRLRKLTLGIDTDTLTVLMPWAQLTDLTLFCDSPLIALDVLAQCPNLTRGAVSTAGWDGLLPTNRDIVALSHLQRLSLPFLASAGDVTPLFDYRSAPALEELCLDFEDMIVDDHECWPNSSRFTAFLLRSPHITRLELTDLRHSTLSSDDILAFLQHTVYLTHLKLTEPSSDCFDDVLISALTYHDGKIPLVPYLQYFVLESTYIMNFTEDILAEMIASRWWIDAESTTPPSVARWTNVELGGDHEFSEHFMDIMMDVREREGLPIIFFVFEFEGG